MQLNIYIHIYIYMYIYIYICCIVYYAIFVSRSVGIVDIHEMNSLNKTNFDCVVSVI